MIGSEPLPLRLTTAWGGFREAAVIPERYGVTGGSALQYDQQRTIFVWANHAVAAIDSVTILGVDPGGWQPLLGFVDVAGHPVAGVQFAAPVPEGSDVVIRGRGKLNPDTGGLMDNPADVLFDILATIGGGTLSKTQLDAFRSECSSRSLKIGGSLTQADSAQTVARAIVASLGASYSADARLAAFLNPSGAAKPARFSVTDAAGLQLEADIANLANDLTVQFDYENGQPQQTIRLTAPASIARYGSRPSTLSAEWITDARVALDVGTRVLQQSARPRWNVTASALKSVPRVGDYLALLSALLAPDGTFPVLTRTYDFTANTSAVTFEVPVGEAPAVELVSQATAYGPNVYSGVTVQQQGSDFTIHIYDVDITTNPPTITGDAAGARVTPDGNQSATQVTDSAGLATFPSTILGPGPHSLYILMQDGRAWTSQISI
jgi:hypothetical protein